MRKLLLTLVPAVLMASGAAMAGTAEVTYEQPERFTDAGRGEQVPSVQKTLTEALQHLAAQGLPASQTLKVTITDIDLAGEIPPGQVRLTETRVMGRNADWPRIHLRYSLQDGDRVVAQGSETLSDMSYLMRSSFLSGSGDLPYERRMLGEWFSDRFGKNARH